jgi:hypothetical protein
MSQSSVLTDKYGSPASLEEKKGLDGHFALRASLKGNLETLYETWIDNWWLWEILGWSMSALSMSLITLILFCIDGKPVATSGITVNGMISILSNIAKAALLLPTAEALGQLKWSWFFHASRKVDDFEVFEYASRGPWGALVLLWQTRAR